MQIKYKTGPKAGTTTHCPRSQEIQVLLDLGIIEEILPAPPAPARVTWTVNVGQVTQRLFIAGRCSRAMCGTFHYEGPTTGASKLKFLHSCGSDAMPENLPTEVIERYARAKGEEQAVITKDEGVFWRIFNNKSTDNQHREVDHGKGDPNRKLAYES